jgi:hypothetical protein
MAKAELHVGTRIDSLERPPGLERRESYLSANRKPTYYTGLSLISKGKLVLIGGGKPHQIPVAVKAPLPDNEDSERVSFISKQIALILIRSNVLHCVSNSEFSVKATSGSTSHDTPTFCL